MRYLLLLASVTASVFLQVTVHAQSERCNVLAYYTGDSAQINDYNVSQLTHIIYSFTHLKGNNLNVDNAKDSAAIRKLVSLKKTYPNLKVILSMGGWGGCETCSQVYSTPEGRKAFASSSKHTLQYFGADGVDLDWEYPAISGYPGHRFLPQDKQNFTALLAEMRRQYGKKYEISFAAGGFANYIDSSIEWSKVVPLLDRINLMTYDLVNGFSVVSGHATPLYSTLQGKESVANAVHMLDSLKVPLRKLVVGAAFYARVFKLTDTLQNGLYQPCTFLKGIDYKDLMASVNSDANYVYHWDSTAHAPYYFNAKEKLLVTFDDKKSIAEKTRYAIEHGLDGIMFWELMNDTGANGLLQAIDDAKSNRRIGMNR